MSVYQPQSSSTGATAIVNRVIIVDDSAVIRGIISRALEGLNDIKVVGTANNGETAAAMLRKYPADIVILDVEMPVMDGLTAIPLLKGIDPAVQIVMASTLTQKNADTSLKALELGATDYIPKPSSDRLIGADLDTFNAELIEKVRAFGKLARRKGVRLTTEAVDLTKVEEVTRKTPFTLRPMPLVKPDILAIGSSTGGPQALYEVIRVLGGNINIPIVVTQHMPASFTRILADHISRQCAVSCKEAEDGELVKAGQYYVAPGDFHMQFVKKAHGLCVKLTKDPPENFCRPAVDPMLRSLVENFGKKILCIILTGMGQDGCKGCEAIVNAGGIVIAQDEASSVVWGMPGAVATGGLCSAVMPVNQIGAAARKIMAGG